jgi:hypothetical protein
MTLGSWVEVEIGLVGLIRSASEAEVGGAQTHAVGDGEVEDRCLMLC